MERPFLAMNKIDGANKNQTKEMKKLRREEKKNMAAEYNKNATKNLIKCLQFARDIRSEN